MHFLPGSLSPAGLEQASSLGVRIENILSERTREIYEATGEYPENYLSTQLFVSSTQPRTVETLKYIVSKFSRNPSSRQHILEKETFQKDSSAAVELILSLLKEYSSYRGVPVSLGIVVGHDPIIAHLAARIVEQNDFVFHGDEGLLRRTPECGTYHVRFDGKTVTYLG